MEMVAEVSNQPCLALNLLWKAAAGAEHPEVGWKEWMGLLRQPEGHWLCSAKGFLTSTWCR